MAPAKEELNIPGGNARQNLVKSDAPDVCAKCSYSLHTLADAAACPECGTSVLQSRTTPRIRRLHQRFIQRIPGGWKTVITSIFAVFVLGITWFTVAHGRVAVEEFCPQTFQFRTRWWYEIPIVRWRVTGDKEIVVRDTQVGDMLRESGWLPTAANASTWYLVSANRYGDPAAVGVASSVREFEHLNGDPMVRWTLRWPHVAAVLWPIVIRELQRDEEAALAAMTILSESDGTLDNLWLDLEPDRDRIRSTLEYWVANPKTGRPHREVIFPSKAIDR